MFSGKSSLIFSCQNILHFMLKSRCLYKNRNDVANELSTISFIDKFAFSKKNDNNEIRLSKNISLLFHLNIKSLVTRFSTKNSLLFWSK